jgi:tetratricopeptide (TPR) repeat protein
VAGALASYKKALAVREKIVDASPAFLADRVKGHTRIAQVLTAQGKMQDAERYLKEALAFGAGTAAGKDYEVRAALAGLYNTFGALQISKVAYGEAEKFLLKQLEIAQQLAKLGREPGAEQIALSVAHTKLGEAYTQMDRMPEAADHLRQALELDQKLAAAEPNSLPRMRKLFITNVLLGRVLRSRSGSQLGKPGEVEQVLDTGATIADKMMAADPNNSLAVMDVVMGRTAQGDWQKNAGQIQAALASYRKALDAVVRLDNPHAGYGSLDALTQTHQRMAAGLGKANQPDTALDHLRKAEEYLARADSVNPGSNRGAMRKAEILGSRADVYGAQKKWADAITNLKAVIAIFEGQRSKDPKNEALLSEQPALYAQLADCYASAGQTDNAARAMRTALDRAGEIAAKRPLVAEEERDRQTNLAKLSQWDRPAK